MKKGNGLMHVLMALLITLVVGGRSFAEVAFYIVDQGSPAPGLSSYMVKVDGATGFSGITIDGVVHQANYIEAPSPGNGFTEMVVGSVFQDDLYGVARDYDTHFMFDSSEVSIIPGSDFSDTETNDKSNPSSVEDGYGGYYSFGLGTFSSDPNAGFTFSSPLAPDTDFMQVVIPTGSWFSISGSVSDDNQTYPFVHYGLPLDPCHSIIATTPGDGGTLEFGCARVGTTSTAPIIMMDDNGCSVCPSWGIFPAASGEFGPYSELQTGGLNDDFSESRTYTYSPSDRGSDTQQVVVVSRSPYSEYSWSSSEITLSGTGVGPVFESSVTPGDVIDLGEVAVDLATDIILEIYNGTTDGDLGDLTDLTLLSAQISGEDADMFSVDGFLPGMVLSPSELASLLLRFNAAGAANGQHTATLTLITDQNAAFGSAGEEFVFQLEAMVVPEPTGILMLVVGVTLLIARGWRRKR